MGSNLSEKPAVYTVKLEFIAVGEPDRVPDLQREAERLMCKSEAVQAFMRASGIGEILPGISIDVDWWTAKKVAARVAKNRAARAKGGTTDGR